MAPAVPPCVETSELARALFTTDASIYRVEPRAVATPTTTAELLDVLAWARSEGLPVTPRGAGTSCAGNAIGEGVVVNLHRHLTRVLAVDPETRTARVEPGVVQQTLQEAAAPFGLRFGPDPSTSTRCTVGGMIANNACGPRALAYGKTADNVAGLEVVTGTGERLSLGGSERGRTDSPTLVALERLVAENLGLIRTEFGRFGRQVSGYSLEHLLPENGFDVARFLAGTEGTLAVITEASVRLVADDPVSVLVALGYDSMDLAADDTPVLLAHSPIAIEGLDARIVDVVRRARGAAAVPPLPEGRGWVFVELRGDDRRAVLERAHAMHAASSCRDGLVVEDATVSAALWRIRADGAGLAGVSLARPAHPGWEDAAVPPERLGDYLRAFDALLARHGLQCLPYGHFGDGCVHARIDFPLDRPGGDVAYRAFVTEAAELVASFGGSMSGEHGDGRARSALLASMYSPEALRLMGRVKAIFDPEGLLNPGVLVDPRPVEADIRLQQIVRRPEDALTGLIGEVHRCSGVGKCLADSTAGGGVMCPSYQATKHEKDSTRGRSRVLQEMINGGVITAGPASDAVLESLDLCLSCKGCARDCPTGIDMASYKSQVIDQRWRGRVWRPRSHYAMGWLPRWGRLITAVPGLGRAINTAMRVPGLVHVARWGAGVDQRRPLPRFASVSGRRRAARAAGSTPGGREVVVWADSFSDAFEGDTLTPMLDVLRAAGCAPRVLQRTACCGLTWISTGQRDLAAQHLRESLDVLHPIVAAGTPVIGVEPSCLAVWRSDAAELVDDPRVADVAAGISTLAEFLATLPDWTPPDLTGTEIIAQPHCHHASVLGWGPDRALLERTGARVTTLGGCCGLAGNFGVERGHYEVSVAVAEHDLLPALAASPDALVLADGFSCRLQAEQLGGRTPLTLAQLLARTVAR